MIRQCHLSRFQRQFSFQEPLAREARGLLKGFDASGTLNQSLHLRRRNLHSGRHLAVKVVGHDGSRIIRKLGHRLKARSPCM